MIHKYVIYIAKIKDQATLEMVMGTPGSSASRTRRKVLKVVLLGDGGVGKSSLMTRFVNGTFAPDTYHTIGVEFLTKELAVDGSPYTLQIWDTAGQERFKSLRTPFYRGADCCLLTFALDDRASLGNLRTWRSEFLYYADVDDADAFPFVLVGNKCDAPDRAVTPEEVDAWRLNEETALAAAPYVETSAKEAVNVEPAFACVVKQLVRSEADFERKCTIETVDLSKEMAKGSGCC